MSVNSVTFQFMDQEEVRVTEACTNDPNSRLLAKTHSSDIWKDKDGFDREVAAWYADKTRQGPKHDGYFEPRASYPNLIQICAKAFASGAVPSTVTSMVLQLVAAAPGPKPGSQISYLFKPLSLTVLHEVGEKLKSAQPAAYTTAQLGC